jgi:4-diphosphocytidyl-2-C-methyl-D-erythritol kinase
MKTIKLKAPAKVNLRLDVLSKRSDGYHDLRMLNSAVSLFDDIEINIVEKGITVECYNDPLVPSGEANIAFQATKEIMAYSNKNVGIHININKNIPSGAGMGGGSSNAASVILGLNQMLHINLSRDKLIKIGGRFGADIPFFLYGSPAMATGIGENLTKIKKLPKMPLVIITPNLSVSTKAIYEKYQVNGNGHDEFPTEFPTKKAVVKFLNNDLEKVTAKQYPIVNELKELLIKHGALAAQMTGSGPSVFGIFSDRETAEKAYKKLSSKEENYRIFLAENI